MLFWGSSSGGSGDSTGAGGNEADRASVDRLPVVLALWAAVAEWAGWRLGGAGGGMEESFVVQMLKQVPIYWWLSRQDRQRMSAQPTVNFRFSRQRSNVRSLNRDGDKVLSPSRTGTVYGSTNGEFVEEVGSNVNLQGVQGLWNLLNTFTGAVEPKLLRTGPDGRFRQPYRRQLWLTCGSGDRRAFDQIPSS